MSLVEYHQPTALSTLADTGNRWIDLVAPAAELAAKIAGTEFVPQEMRGKPAVVAACILFGSELGIGPMQALAKVDIVKGRPAPKAELARALALAAGHEVWVEEQTNTRCTVAGKRRGSDHEHRVTWTLDDVKKAGIVNQAYSKYPRQMLLARASAELVRAMCPDVLGGIGQFAEEVEGGDTEPTAVGAPAPAVASAKRQRKPLNMATSAPAELPPLPTDDEPIVDAEVIEADAVTDAQIRKMAVAFNAAGITGRDERLTRVCTIVRRDVASSKELTKAEASRVIDTLEAEARERETLPDGELFEGES